MSDRLPPHSEEAEQGVLGCILQGADFYGALEYLETEMVFYDLRHRTVFNAMKGLKLEGKPIDMITLVSRLKDTKNVEACGGTPYLSELPDKTPSAANVDHYLRIVKEKYLAREFIGLGITWATRFGESGVVAESHITQAARELSQIQLMATRHLKTRPLHLASPEEFANAYMDLWFNKHAGEPGWELPFKYPLKIRLGEVTVLTGDSGTGKSSILGQIYIRLIQQGARVCIASMEVPPAVTLWIMARQLIGTKELPDSEQGRQRAKDALGWLAGHVRIYNFLGITDWREMLDTFDYAAEHEACTVYGIDSVMRIGIPDDDFAMQGLVSAKIAGWAQKRNAHVFEVIHENKGDGSMKNKVRGSKQWTDNAHNVAGMIRHEAKSQKIEDLWEKKRTGEITQESFDQEMEKIWGKWDSKFVHSKQRWPSSRQNGAKFLFFHHGSLQFLEQSTDQPINYLAQMN
jgi:energy-coupling factor transporter ATP-binding protein EcfA2